MELLSHLTLGFQTVLTPGNLLFCFLGVSIGTLIGVLPGIGPTATVAILLPITFSFEPVTSLIMLAGIYYGAQYGGSTTAILVNLPGEASAVVTALDGYQMARQGRAGAALAAAALGSFLAGTVSTLIIALFALPLAALALEFGPAEYFSLMVLGLVSSVTLASGSVLKAIGMILLGLMLGLIGTDIYTGESRFTWGVIDLVDGVDFVVVALGLFGIAEILRNLEDERTRTTNIAKVGGLWPTKEDMRRIIPASLRGTFTGSLLGLLPGGGATLSAFAAYAIEKKVSRTPEQFGKGAIEGVAGPESANNAGAQTSFVPTLTLGIPSNPLMALLIGAMIIQGVVPGPSVITDQPALFWGIIVSMWIGNLMLVILNLPLIGIWVRLLTIPYYVLFPAILAFCAIGVYAVGGNAFSLYLVLGFGVLGYVMTKLDCEPAPMLLGFILGPMLEEHLRRAMILGRGDPMYFLERPVSLVLLAIALLALLIVILPSISRKRKEVFVGD